MTDSNLIELAKLGDPQAIAALMNQSLESRGMRATVDRQGNCLEVILEAERIPNRQSLTAFVQKGINNLGIQSIASIRILGQQVGASYPAWMQELHLDVSPGAESGTASLPIQSETAIDSPTIPEEPTARLGGEDFSITDSMNVDLATSEPMPESAADLNELWTPSPEPDFLQELLATEPVTTSDLSTQRNTDEPAATDDEGLMDFLNDLSGEPAQEEFPAEPIQQQSRFLGELDSAESINFQDLFAEADEASNGLSNEAGGLPWEETGESIVAGEPDADLLDFLNTPDEPLTMSEEFTLADVQDDRPMSRDLPPNEQILTEYPDALSIDHLPEDLFADPVDPEAPLQEPSEDFLSTLLGEPIESPISEPFPDSIEEVSQPLVNHQNDPDPISEPMAEPLLQDPWATDLGAPAAKFDGPEFPEDVSGDLAPFSTASFTEDNDLEEALPDFLVEPMLDLPEADPAEMTLDELEQQTEVLDAAIEESIDQTSQFLPDELDALAAPLHDERSEDEVPSVSLNEEGSSDAASLQHVEGSTSEAFETPEFETETPPSEAPSPSLPDAALLSNFADSQPDGAFWTEESEDEIEEIPPDFLQEMQDWPAFEPEASPPSVPAMELSTFPAEIEPPISPIADETGELEQPSSPGPEWSDLEAQLSALDLLPDQAATAAVDGDLALPEPEVSIDSPGIDSPGMESVEPLIETPEGTAIEPPADWVAAASLADLEADSIAEISSSTEASPVNAEFTAASSEASEPDAATAATMPELSQDELEAGLGDFRAGFVEPLPPEFFEEDEPQTSYPDWQADLREPLSLDEEDDETGYIIEDNTPDVEYTPPPLPLDPEVQPSSSSPASGVFVMVLFALCAFLGMLGGYVLFKSKLSPSPSNVPPPAEPPAPESPPASPTSANPVGPIANQTIDTTQASDRAFGAILMGPIVQSEDWQQTIELAGEVRPEQSMEDTAS